MNRILVPIDFSDNAERTLNAAKIMAGKENELVILHAYEPYIADVNLTPGNVVPAVGGTDFLSMTNELEAEYRQRLDQYAAELTAEGYKAEARWVLGSIRSAVDDAIEEYDPSLIVIGRTGTGGFFDKLIGSSATDIALHAKCPVLVIPPQVTPTAFRKIVYAAQFEFDENDILRAVFVLLNRLGASLTLLKIQADNQPDIQPDNQYIAEIRNTFAITDDQIVIRKADDVMEGIERYCDEVNADLLITSTRERSFIEEFIINPSITRKLILDTHIPLLVFHLKS